LGLPVQIQLLAAISLAFSGEAALAQELASATSPLSGEPSYTRPLEEEAEAPLEPELAAESGIYLQRRLGEWSREDARKVLGQPRRRRDALENGAVTGDIFTFDDPSHRYREFELMFDRQSKTLRAVFIYPWRMTWDDCRELWGDDVNTTNLASGAIFRAYLSRRLDVLSDSQGKVINLGIY
jgi:hypothetical protein